MKAEKVQETIQNMATRSTGYAEAKFPAIFSFRTDIISALYNSRCDPKLICFGRIVVISTAFIVVKGLYNSLKNFKLEIVGL